MKEKNRMMLVIMVICVLLIYPLSSSHPAAEDVAALYKGKTIVYTVGSSPGGGYDTWTRMLAKALEKVTGATVVVKNIPEAGGVVALDDIYHSKNARGFKIHTARAILPPLLQATGFPGTTARWDIAELQWIGRISVDVPAFAVNPKKYKSIDDVRAAKEFLCGVDAAMSVSGTRTAIAFEALGLANAKIVAGYPGGSERRLATIQGELDGTSGSYDSLEKYFASGDLKCIWVMTEERLKEAPDVPTIYELGLAKEGQKWLDWEMKIEKSGRTVVAPPDTPKDRVKFLRDAMAKAVVDPSFVKTVEKVKYSIQYLRGDDVQDLMIEIMKLSPKEKEELIHILKTKYVK